MRRRLLIALAVLVAGYLTWYYQVHYPVRSTGEPPVQLTIAPGTTGETIAHLLQERGLVRFPWVFRVLMRLRGAGGRLRAGEYRFDGPLSLDQIVDILVKGEIIRRELTVPEGECLEEIVQLVAAQGLDTAPFLAAAGDPTPIRDLDPQATDLEGYLYPDTYDAGFAPNASAVLVKRMVERFREVIAPELPFLPERKLTLRQVVTLASLVELETGRGEERARIAAVFLNRIRKKMLLQADPTVIYALRKAGRWDGNIRKPDLSMDSPYNTYRHVGLPPGPIASPGRSALLAVLHPAPVRDLYFVSRNDGTHQFSETLTEHERAVDLYQRRRGGRRGG